jgi:hypothetical protein
MFTTVGHIRFAPKNRQASFPRIRSNGSVVLGATRHANLTTLQILPADDERATHPWQNFCNEIIRNLPSDPCSNCQMFATLATNISRVTIAPHENQI